MESKEKETSKTTNKKKSGITKKELMKKEFKKYLEEQLEHPENWALRLTEAWIKKFNNPLSSYHAFNLSDRIESEQEKLRKTIAEFFAKELKFEEIERKVKKEFLLLQKKKTKEKIFPTLEPFEKNLINLPLWYPTVKGLPKQKLEIKTWTLKKDNIQIEYDYQLSLPTVFTFETIGILLGIWQNQGYSDTFYTTLGEICKRKGIPSTHGNRNLVLIALRQLHNTHISTPFWEIDNKGKKRRKSVWKINIINIEAENIQPGRNHTIELRINKYIANNIKQRYFTLLDYKLLNKLKSPTAKRLYPIIKQYRNPYQRKLFKLKKLLNLRDAHAKQTLERASQELVNINFLSSFKIEKGKKVAGLVYRAYKSKKLKGSKTALKG